MSDFKQLIKNNGFVFANRIVSKFITLAVLLVIARRLGPAQFGELTLLIAITFVFMTLQDMGTNVVIVRETARDPSRRMSLLRITLILKLFTGIAAFLAMQGFIALWGYAGTLGGVAMLFGAGMFFESYLLTLVKHLEGREKMNLSGLLVITERVVFVGALFLFLRSLDMFRAYAYAYIVSNVLAFILGGVLIRLPLTNAAESQHRAGIVRLLKLTKYFFLFNVLGIVYTRLDLFLIEKYLSISQVGSYRAVNQLVESIYFIPTSISVTLLPLFSRLFVQSGGKLHAFFNLVTKQIAFLGAIISIASYFFAEDIVRLLYGVKYQSGVEVLKLFSFIFPIYFVNNFLGNLLIAIKQEKKQFKSFVISFCIKIASLFAFINLLGLQGAVIAALIAECSMLFWQYFFTQKNSYRIKLDRRDGIVILLLLVLCGVVSIQFHTVVTLSLFVAAGASYVYFAVVSLKRNLTTAKEGGVG